MSPENNINNRDDNNVGGSSNNTKKKYIIAWNVAECFFAGQNSLHNAV